MQARRNETKWVLFFLFAYVCLNLLFLTRYPLVHSDESWLAGLTRNMMKTGSLGVTEPFFDLKPRFPHAIKILFHLMQMPFIWVFGYTATSVRLLSLLAGAFALYLTFRCLRECVSFGLSFAAMAVVSIDGQFLSAAHTLRQEILLLCLLLSLALILIRSRGEITARRAAWLGLITGISAGLHPNSFLLAAGCGAAMLFIMAARRKFEIKPLLIYIAVTGLLALCFVFISLLFDSQFIAHYKTYGETEFDLFVPVSNKFTEYFYYIQKLWFSVSGTYSLPVLKPHLILLPILLLFGGIKAARTKETSLLTLLGMTAGGVLATILIGRYNQLSAILWMFPCLMLSVPLLSGMRIRKAACILLAAVITAASILSIRSSLPFTYKGFLAQLSSYVSPEEKTLGNLNTGFYFDNDALLDLRNLSYMKENNMTFSEYVKTRGIQVILWPEELDFIYSRRPAFNMIYGNPRYVEEAEAFLKTQCTLTGEVENGGYAVRIQQEIGKPYKIRVYRVNQTAGGTNPP